MANVKRGQTVPAPQWWRHLRDWKRVFWKRQRGADKESILRRQREIIEDTRVRHADTLKAMKER